MTDRRTELVQAIVVGPDGTHLEVVDAAMRASSLALLNRSDDALWLRWLSGSFTKTVRRVNATQLENLAADGTAFVGPNGIAAVAFAPMVLADLPRPVARARVSGLERDRTPQPPLGSGLWVWLNGDLMMSTGKSAAQAAHALMTWTLMQRDLPTELPPVQVAEVDPATFAAGQRDTRYPVITDAGRTEIAPGSPTAVIVEVG